jgi:ABC-type antimicrobial peptide transport system permease subunit
MLLLAIITWTVKVYGEEFNLPMGSVSMKKLDDIENAIIDLNYSIIKSHVEFFSSLSSRVTGYPGSYEAANYIISKFREYGLNVIVQNYSMAMPIDLGSWIKTKDGRQINAYALWPNGPQTCFTPPEGITGKLIYVREGDLRCFNGFNIEGSIVLMDFNSGDNWLNAVKLGAKAIIFIEPEYTTLLESLKKAIPVPINVPRLYVKKSDGYLLKEVALRGEEVTIYNGMRWKEITAYNIIGYISGSEYPNSIIVVSSHYDSWSVVPSISPGAEDSLGISILLEVARYFGKNPPIYTIWFTCFSGFYQNIAGPTEWAENVFFSKEVQCGNKTILLHIDLDISTDTNAIDILFTGPPYWFGDVAEMAGTYITVQTSIQKYLSHTDVQGLVRYNIASMRWGTQQALRDWIWFYQLAVQPTIRVALVGFTMRTQYANRPTFFTPLNDIEYIKWENLKPQARIIVTTIAGFANERDWQIPSLIPGRMLWGGAGSRVITGMVFGFVTLNGTVAEYDLNKGWYTPIEGALVRIYYSGSYSSDPNAYLVWPFNSRYTFSGKGGVFIFHGLAPYLTHGVDAWIFNETNGAIIYAVDEGIYGTASGIAGGITTSVYPLSHPTSVLIPIFRCVEITIFDLVDPRLMKRLGVAFSYSPGSLNVYDVKTKSQPVFYGRYLASSYPVGMIFVKPRSKVIITFTPNTVELSRPLVLLTNSSKDNPEGEGFTVEKPLTIYKTALKAAEDLYLLSSGRYEKLKSKNVRNQGVETLIQEGYNYLMEARECFTNALYDKGYAYAMLSLAPLSKAYEGGVMPLFSDITIFTLFFTLVSIISSLFIERLLLHSEGIRKILGVAIIVTMLLVSLNFVTPTFEVMQNSLMGIFGVAILLIGISITLIFLKDASNLMERSAVEKLGMHITRKGEAGLLLHLLGVAVDNMKRRRLTTILTMLTLITFIAAQTAFTSASQVITIQETSLRGEGPRYDGILLKRQYGFPPEQRGTNLDVFTITALEALINDSYSIAPRVWAYPTAVYPYGVSLEVVASKGKTTIINPAIFLGLSSKEANLLFDGWILEGWPTLYSPYNAIISERMAKTLNVSVGDTIFVKNAGINLTIIAITNIPENEMIDFDMNPILPASPTSSSLFARESVGMNENLPPHWVSIDNLIIVPWELAYDLGGFISSIAILPNYNASLSDLKKVGFHIALSMDISVYIKHKENTLGLSRIVSYSIKGWDIMWVLLLIMALSTINALISGLQQRRREIYVYASLGLSPTGAMLMFLTEIIAYAAIATTIGYLFGYCLNLVFIKLSPETFVFNTTSIYIVISLAVIFVACLGVAIYPSIIASKIITPSLERKWKFHTKPRGDLWIIPLPVKSTMKEEILAIYAFLSEYYSGVGAIKPSFMVNSVSQIDKENLSLSLNMLLLPTEMGITQKVTFKGVQQKDKTFTLNLLIERLTGDYDSWVSRNYYFIDDLRKQIMLWKTIPDKRKYFQSNSMK